MELFFLLHSKIENPIVSCLQQIHFIVPKVSDNDDSNQHHGIYAISNNGWENAPITTNLNRNRQIKFYIWLSYTSYEFSSKSNMLIVCVFVYPSPFKQAKNMDSLMSVVNSKLACLILCTNTHTIHRRYERFYFKMDNSKVNQNSSPKKTRAKPFWFDKWI